MKKHGDDDDDGDVSHDEMYLEYLPLNHLERFPRNPKLHSDKIVASFEEYGYVNPMIIDEATGRLVAGHGRLEKLQDLRRAGEPPPDRIKVAPDGTWLAPVIRGIHFTSMEQAERYLIDDNMTSQLGGWDEPLLADISAEIGPVSFSMEAVDEAVRRIQADTLPSPMSDTSSTKDPISNDGDSSLDEGEDIPEELQHVLQLDDSSVWPASNIHGIPDLRPDLLLDRLPEPLDTWGDRQTTPDDGKTWWLYNQGPASTSALPGERTILSLFSWDRVLEAWWKTPAYMAARFLKMGIRTAIVPDFSIWDSQPVANQLWSVQRSMWTGRFLQEAGYQVIPRIEYFVCRASLPKDTPGAPTPCDTINDKHHPLCPRSYTLAGIPPAPPVVATQMHTGFADEHVPGIQSALIQAIHRVRPKQLLVYASIRGEALVEDIRGRLDCDMRILPAVERKRRVFAKQAERDPVLRQLRRRRREGEPARATSPEK